VCLSYSDSAGLSSRYVAYLQGIGQDESDVPQEHCMLPCAEENTLLNGSDM